MATKIESKSSFDRHTFVLSSEDGVEYTLAHGPDKLSMRHAATVQRMRALIESDDVYALRALIDKLFLFPVPGR